MNKKALHFSMKWKLILSFSVVAIIFLGVAVYQGYKIDLVRSSMKIQKIETEKRMKVATMTQLLQELNREEGALAESSDLEKVELFKEKQHQFQQDMGGLDFEANSLAEVDLQLLEGQFAQYIEKFDEMTATMEDTALDPLVVLEKIDEIHTELQYLNRTLMKVNDQLYSAVTGNAEQAQDTSFNLLQDTTSITVYAAFLVSCFTFIIAVILIRSFTIPVRKLSTAVKKISEGDLRHRIHSPHNDELGQLSHHFDHMVLSVREMLQKTRTAASQLADHADSFQQASEVTAQANHDIVTTIQEISGGAEQQAEQSEHSSNLIQQLEVGIAEIKQFAEIMVSTSQSATQNAQHGSETVSSLQVVSRQSRHAIDKVHEALMVLVEQSEQISKITHSITEISNHTNILSLNAAIEASLAGSHGKGFSVIAAEVRKLSMQTKTSSQHIETMVEELRNSMVHIQTHMLATKDSLYMQEEKVTETLQSFQSIDQSIEDITMQIGQIHEKVDVANTQNSILAKSLSTVASIAEETAASVQEVNASSLIQDHTITDIAKQAAEINEISQQLFKEINVFQIHDDNEVREKVEGSSFAPGKLSTVSVGV